jgi:hypothetical protein
MNERGKSGSQLESYSVDNLSNSTKNKSILFVSVMLIFRTEHWWKGQNFYLSWQIGFFCVFRLLIWIRRVVMVLMYDSLQDIDDDDDDADDATATTSRNDWVAGKKRIIGGAAYNCCHWVSVPIERIVRGHRALVSAY